VADVYISEKKQITFFYCIYPLVVIYA